MAWSTGDRAGMRVERVEEPSVVGFTWHIHGLPADDPRRTYVGSTLGPVGDGTRLTVTETGFAQLGATAHATALDGDVRGRAGELVDHLDAA